ncbi:GyrI-like domain-containing protein [Parenemella sanctibonifatiensis]|uniref:GyrI-like small molecule binding domain-containing protein n=1 Tax=Parenemella sanctibonifatiensis TaxID=2016505 RepID=A0A255ERQ6_9ACTN|nr:GyrI-like domain-containing protein [Parenemella sanctibonifatiensis]OYN92275.1 hypothetical protein CGZ91_01840 [Parenemella sanctibonifatiensis]
MAYDIKKDLKHLYRPGAGDFVEVTVPPLRHLAVDGHGNPNTSPAYATAVQCLYAAAYTIKFAAKAGGNDFVVPPLEGLWSSADPAAFAASDKDSWDWTMLIVIPDLVPEADVETGLAQAVNEKPELPVGDVAIRTLAEGRSLQILHVGAYDDEAATLHRLHHEVMPARGLTFNGHHHEVYLSHPRRVPPERLKTILRQPVRRAS